MADLPPGYILIGKTRLNVYHVTHYEPSDTGGTQIHLSNGKTLGTVEPPPHIDVIFDGKLMERYI